MKYLGNILSSRARGALGFIVFGLLSLAVLLLALNAAFPDTDDALFAWGVRDAIREGRWLDYKWFGVSFQQAYPPTGYILSRISAQIFGVDEFGIRLFPTLCAWGTLLITVASCRILCKNLWSGVFAATSLLSLTIYYYYGKAAGVDTTLMLCITTTQYLALLALRDPRKWAWCGIAAGLAIMSKGMAAGPPLMGLLLALGVSTQRPSMRNILKAIALGTLVAAPWHIYQTLRFGQVFWQHYIGYNVAHRYASSIAGTNTPWHFYLSTLFRTDTIMTIMLFSGALLSIVSWGRDRSPRLAIFAGPLLLSLLLFSLSSTHIFKYLLPVLPSLCVLAAVGLNKVFGKLPRVAVIILLPLVVFLTHTLPLTSGAQLPPGLQDLSLRSQEHLKANQPLYVFDAYYAAAAYYSDRPMVLVTSDARNYNILMAVPGLRMSNTIVFVANDKLSSFFKSLVAPTLLVVKRLQPVVKGALAQAGLQMQSTSEGEYLLLWQK